MKKEKSLHQELIDLLVAQDPRMRTRGFRRAAAAASETFRTCIENGCECSATPVPDAYLIDEEQQTIWVFEVEVTNGLSTENLDRYRAMFWSVDGDYWQLQVVVVDKYGVGRITRLLTATGIDDPGKLAVLPHDGPALNVRAEGSMPRWLGEVYQLRVERLDDRTSDPSAGLAMDMDLWPIGL